MMLITISSNLLDNLICLLQYSITYLLLPSVTIAITSHFTVYGDGVLSRVGGVLVGFE
jgi:hypothetical protein